MDLTPSALLDTGLLDAAGMTRVEQLVLLLQHGYEDEHGLVHRLRRRRTVLARARLLADAARAGVEKDLLEALAAVTQVHWVSVKACLFHRDRSGPSRFRMYDPADGGAELAAAARGIVTVTGDGVKRIPAGLASPASIFLDELPDLEELPRVPEAPDLVFVNCGLQDLDLRGSKVRTVMVMGCEHLRTIRAGRLDRLRLERCPRLERVLLDTFPAKAPVVLECPSLTGPVSGPWMDNA